MHPNIPLYHEDLWDEDNSFKTLNNHTIIVFRAAFTVRYSVIFEHIILVSWCSHAFWWPNIPLILHRVGVLKHPDCIIPLVIFRRPSLYRECGVSRIPQVHLTLSTSASLCPQINWSTFGLWSDCFNGPRLAAVHLAEPQAALVGAREWSCLWYVCGRASSSCPASKQMIYLTQWGRKQTTSTSQTTQANAFL